jgi:RNA polymerase sigma-70 factor (ECF subfamily)
MADRPLEDAMTRYAAGDDGALAAVYDLLAPQLFVFLRRTCRDATLAEDLTHETFLRIVRARALYKPGADVVPWAYSIGRRLFLDSIRSNRRVVASLDDPGTGERRSDPGIPHPDAPADEQVSAHRLAERIEDVLADIPETQATAFRLLKQEGLAVAEAAQILGTTETSVKLRAHRAYEALREALGTSWEVPERRAGKRAEVS